MPPTPPSLASRRQPSNPSSSPPSSPREPAAFQLRLLPHRAAPMKRRAAETSAPDPRLEPPRRGGNAAAALRLLPGLLCAGVLLELDIGSAASVDGLEATGHSHVSRPQGRRCRRRGPVRARRRRFQRGGRRGGRSSRFASSRQNITASASVTATPEHYGEPLLGCRAGELWPCPAVGVRPALSQIQGQAPMAR